MSEGKDIVLAVEDVSKKFAKTHRAARRLAGDQIGGAVWGGKRLSRELRKDEFWALQDIDFSVERGETLGVVGFNGSGKTTLLRVLFGVMLPDFGEVRSRGDVSGLIELNAGVKPHLSGRENIFIKGALLGKAREEIEALYDSIAEFSELGDFLEAPFSTYSSGMRLRLGFSVASAVQPDVLLLDEILAVGDHGFRAKCEARLREMREGSGVVFASHSLAAIEKMCARTLVLDKGQMAFLGETAEAIELHTHMRNEAAKSASVGPSVSRVPFYGRTVNRPDRIADVVGYWGDEAGAARDVYRVDEPGTFHLSFTLAEPVKEKLVAGVTLWRQDGKRITTLSTDMAESTVFDLGGVRQTVRLSLPAMALNPGNYVSTLAIVADEKCVHRQKNNDVSITSRWTHLGMVTLAHAWERKEDAAPAADEGDEQRPPKRVGV